MARPTEMTVTDGGADPAHASSESKRGERRGTRPLCRSWRTKKGRLFLPDCRKLSEGRGGRERGDKVFLEWFTRRGEGNSKKRG